MDVRVLILIPLLYFLALLQTSFFVHFSILGITPDFILILVTLVSLFAPSFAVGSALAGGFFLDIFSSHFIGFNVLILLGLVIFIKMVLKRYVQIPGQIKNKEIL